MKSPALNLKIKLERINIFIILIPPIYEYDVSLILFRSTLIYFEKITHFLYIFIPRYFLFPPFFVWKVVSYTIPLLIHIFSCIIPIDNKKA